MHGNLLKIQIPGIYLSGLLYSYMSMFHKQFSIYFVQREKDNAKSLYFMNYINIQ
jgi:hypothetical protein